METADKAIAEVGSIHGLSQQGLGVFLDTQTLQKHPSGHPIVLVKNFLKCQSQASN